jgi:hypothetical protein
LDVPEVKENIGMDDGTVSYDLGVTRLFGECDLNGDGLCAGWAVPEKAHVWNDGLDAIFELNMDKPEAPCRLTFEGEPFLNGDCKRQDVVLYVNGFRTGFWRLKEARTHSLSVTLEPEQIFNRGNKAFARCVWHLPDSVRPAELGLGADSRQLGFCFRSFLIAYAG